MIRRYRDEDLADALEAWETASRVAHPFLSEEFLAQERRDMALIFLPRSETWVWEEAGRVMGFLSMAGKEVGGLFVHADHHCKGIGRALMDHVRDLHGTLELEVFEANPIGRAFYAGYGFVLKEAVTDEATGLPALRLRLDPEA